MKPNMELAKRKGVTDEGKQVLEYLYADLTSILTRPLMYFSSYKEATEYVDCLETVLQRVWDFDYNPNYKTYKFEFKDCICPKMDNKDLQGTGRFVYNGSCPVHKHLFGGD